MAERVKRTQSRTVVTVISRISERPVAKEACLVVIYGMDLGKKFNLDTPTVNIGRSSKCDIQVDQESVSRNHARIINTGKSLILRDLGSTNGTYVNDAVVDEYVLRDADLIKIGRTIFKFLTGDNVENNYHEEIYRLTTIDGLTQIFNKRYFLETLERETSRAQRYSRALSLVMFDIDHFKLVNDTHGHLAGDAVLKQLATAIKEHVRREDTLSRYGGEEFALILPEVDLPSAIRTAEKLRALIEKTAFRFEQQTLPVTISLGVATMSAEIKDQGEFVRVADERLYAAKAGGRNKVGT